MESTTKVGFAKDVGKFAKKMDVVKSSGGQPYQSVVIVIRKYTISYGPAQHMHWHERSVTFRWIIKKV